MYVWGNNQGTFLLIQISSHSSIIHWKDSHTLLTYPPFDKNQLTLCGSISRFVIIIPFICMIILFWLMSFIVSSKRKQYNSSDFVLCKTSVSTPGTLPFQINFRVDSSFLKMVAGVVIEIARNLWPIWAELSSLQYGVFQSMNTEVSPFTLVFLNVPSNRL